MIAIGTKVTLTGPCWLEDFQGLIGTVMAQSLYVNSYHVALDSPPGIWGGMVIANEEMLEVITDAESARTTEADQGSPAPTTSTDTVDLCAELQASIDKMRNNG
jgi:hypothetical protein